MEMEENETEEGSSAEVIRISGDMYRTLVETSDDIIFTVDLKGNFLFTNRAFHKHLGYSDEEIKTLNGFELIHPEDLKGVHERFVQLPQGKKVNDLEYRYRTKDGSYIHLLNNASPIFDSEGNVTGAFGIARNIDERKCMELKLQKAHDELEIHVKQRTVELEEMNRSLKEEIKERKKTEEALRDSEERFRKLIELSYDGIAIHSEGKGVFINQRGAQLLGASEPEMILGQPIINFVHPDFREMAIERVVSVIEGRKPATPVEEKLIRVDGSTLDVETLGIPIRYQGKPAVQMVFRDISQRKAIEEALQESERRYRYVTENIQDVIYSVQPDGIVTFASGASEKIFGVKPEEIVGKNLFKAGELSSISQDKLYELGEIYKQAVEDKVKYMAYDLVIEKGGISQHLEISERLIYDDEGNQVNAIGVIRDITKRKRAETEVKKSQERYHSLFDNMIDGFAYHRIETDETGNPVDYTFLEANSTFEKLTGLKRDNIIGRRATEVFPEIKNLPKDWIEKFGAVALHGGEIRFEIFFPPIKKWFSIRAYCPERGFFAAVFEDITDRKQATEALRESEEKHRTLFETMAQGVLYQDMDGKIIDANPTAERILGLSMDEMLGRTAKDPRWKAIHEDGSDFAGEEHPSAVALRTGKQVQDVIMGVYNPKKIDYNWINVNAVPQFRHGDNKPSNVYTTFNDITEQKKAEAALRNSENRYRKISELISDFVYSVRVEPDGTQIPEWSTETLNRILGMEYADLLREGGWAKVIHPEDLPIVMQRAKNLAEGKPDVSEYRVVVKDGEVHWVRDHGYPIWDKKEGRVVNIYGAAQDITDRKKAEEAIRESEEKFRELADLLPQTVFEMDMKGNLRYSNQFGFDSTGYTKADLDFGMNVLQMIVPEEMERAIENIRRIVGGEEISPNEYTLLTKDGKTFPVLLYSRRIIRNGRPVGLRGIVVDITRQKKNENELKRSLRERELLFRELKHRVKNNLQLLSSMVSMQSMQTKDNNVLKKLQEVQSVIETIALIYSRAYEGPQIRGLNLKNFIEELITDMLKFKVHEDFRVDYSVEGGNVRMNTDQAIPMALIANELIFNALKHAFTGRTEGCISISLKEHDDTVLMTIGDNGIGISPEVDLEKPGSLGLKIVRSLTEQLQGKLSINKDNGTEFTIEVPKEEVK